MPGTKVVRVQCLLYTTTVPGVQIATAVRAILRSAQQYRPVPGEPFGHDIVM